MRNWRKWFQGCEHSCLVSLLTPYHLLPTSLMVGVLRICYETNRCLPAWQLLHGLHNSVNSYCSVSLPFFISMFSSVYHKQCFEVVFLKFLFSSPAANWSVIHWWVCTLTVYALWLVHLKMQTAVTQSKHFCWRIASLNCWLGILTLYSLYLQWVQFV